ncbi:MAG TPA: lipoyl(octanoyl) transferase LipB [Chthoniobacterales bacterium]|nr:lipoyl(octanoyl) transferase LipB [Chthoniobacterales bacterium]
MKVVWLGRIEFSKGLEIQAEALEECDRTGEETLFLLEHEPVYTIGRRLDKSSLGNVGYLPHPVFEINRGGQATYHGPGQLVGYPILDLKKRGKDLHVYLRSVETAVIRLVESFGVEAEFCDGKTGVWVQNRKIASIGIGVRRWISMHGFALNVSSDLTGFLSITPCGLTGVRMTSLGLELGREVSLAEVRDRAAVVLEAEFEGAVIGER